MVELIPVIELEYHDPAIDIPDKYPYWEFPEIWYPYRMTVFKRLGLVLPPRPYIAGFPFYPLSTLSEAHLISFVTHHLEVYKRYIPDPLLPLSGGYILKVEGKNIFYPQGGGDLSDIWYWEDIAKGDEKARSMGHPEPAIIFQGDHVIFEFNDWEGMIIPPPPIFRMSIQRNALMDAVKAVEKELQQLGQQLKTINEVEGLNIPDIDQALIWGY